MELGSALLLIFFVWLCIASPGFRVVALVCGVSSGAVFLWVLYQGNDATDYTRRRAAIEQNEAAQQREIESKKVAAEAESWNRITARDLDVRNFVLKFSSKPSNISYFDAQGTIKNNSPFTLTNVNLAISAMDCPDKDTSTNCEIVGRAWPNVAVRVPSSEVRAVSALIAFENLARTAGTLTFFFSITAARGEP